MKSGKTGRPTKAFAPDASALPRKGRQGNWPTRLRAKAAANHERCEVHDSFSGE
jgi:hypothetical protein